MAQQQIEPSTVTKPIQLLAAWLVGLILVDSVFLTAAANIDHPAWAAGVLAIAAVINVPLFLLFLFLMQTRFRPEMQEDSYYYRYLEKKFSFETQKLEVVEYATPAILPATGKGSTATPVSQGEAKVDNYDLRINDLLPRFSNIFESLQSKGLNISETFGSSSENSVTPTVFVLTFGRAAPVGILQEVINIAAQNGLEAIAFSSSISTSNRIYLGSYLYAKTGHRLVKVTPQLLDQINKPDLKMSDMEALIDTGEQFDQQPSDVKL